jgi:hypothetical protein
MGHTCYEDSLVDFRSVSLEVRGIELLGQKEPACRLGSDQNFRIGSSGEPFDPNAVHFVPETVQFLDERFGEVFVDLDLHAAIAGRGDTGRSSFAEAAAKAMTERSPSAVTVGNPANSWASELPSAKLARRVRTGTRVPLTTQVPPHTSARRSKAPK